MLDDQTRKKKKKKKGSSKNDSVGSKETREINVLRVVTLILLIAIATLSSAGIYLYTANYEQEKFEDCFITNARLVIDSFHNAVERRLGAVSTLADAITSHALSSGETFPRVSLPNFDVVGSGIRAQSQAPLVYWMPLVTDETRNLWEEYALENRFQMDKAFDRDATFRAQQDAAFNVTVPVPDEFNNGRSLEAESQNEPTVLDDGTGSHPKIWANGVFHPRGDEPEGNGPYLPLWQSRCV